METGEWNDMTRGHMPRCVCDHYQVQKAREQS
jgi:hypothetical protein